MSAAKTKHSPLRWATAIITAPRAPSTVGNTRDSLIADAGFPSPIIVNDAWLSGCYRNWRTALSQLLSAAPADTDYLLISEDDCEFTAGLREWLDFCHGNPAQDYFSLRPEAFNSLYCSAGNAPKVYRNPKDPDVLGPLGWREVAVPLYAFGALAYAVAPALARRFLASPPFPNRSNGTDHNIGLFCRREGIKYRVHSPSFVRHMGFAGSALPEDAQGGIDAYRQAATFVERIDGEGNWTIKVLGEGPLVCGEVTCQMPGLAVRPDGPDAG